MKFLNFPEIVEEEIITTQAQEEAVKALILYNDDFNTFEYVINSLIQVCNHQPIQAEQCTYLVHYSGKCVVKNGTLKKLQPYCQALLERGLSAKIEN